MAARGVLARKPWICRLLHWGVPYLTRQPDGLATWECRTCLRRWPRGDGRRYRF